MASSLCRKKRGGVHSCLVTTTNTTCNCMGAFIKYIDKNFHLLSSHPFVDKFATLTYVNSIVDIWVTPPLTCQRFLCMPPMKA